jgi:hypothetical protein
MFELTGKLAYMVGFTANGKPIITLEMNERTDALKMVDSLHSADVLSIKIGKKQNRRSLDANAYCWVLISKLAEKLNISKTEIYRAAIKEIGGNCDTVCVQDKAVKSLCDGWERNGLGWQTDTFPSKIEGCTNVTLYYGSSTYDSAQMARLINLILEECRQVGIETKSAEEIDSLLGQWGAR